MISGNLEYSITSLPYLSFNGSEEQRIEVYAILQKYDGSSTEEQHPVSILDYETAKYLQPKNQFLFRNINLNQIHEDVFQKSKIKVLAAFSNFVFKLKTDLMELRRSRKNASELSALKHGRFENIPKSPLDAEMYLIKLQWDYLEELSFGHFADFSALIIYKLKLLLLLRSWSFDEKTGFNNFISISKLKDHDG